jgi:aminoacyl-tRNA editing protein
MRPRSAARHLVSAVPCPPSPCPSRPLATRLTHALDRSDHGGSAWESNPPRACLEPDTGFEVREAHRDPMRFRSGESSESSVTLWTGAGTGRRQRGPRPAVGPVYSACMEANPLRAPCRHGAAHPGAGHRCAVPDPRACPVRTSAEAAAVGGTPLEAGAKALVVRTDGRPVRLVLPADRRIDNPRLRELLRTRRLRFAATSVRRHRLQRRKPRRHSRDAMRGLRPTRGGTGVCRFSQS